MSYRYIIFNRAWASMLFFTIIIFYSCEREENILGLDLQPSDENLNIEKDTLYPISYTIKEDSLLSNNTSLSLLGAYNDPVFGFTKASFYTQLRIEATDVNFEYETYIHPHYLQPPKVDSVILSLAYDGNYKNQLSNLKIPTTIYVHELLEDIYLDTSYYGSSYFNYSSLIIGEKTFIPLPNDSIVQDSITYEPQLKVKMSKSFGQEIINQSGTSNLANDENFLEYFKGLYITCSDNGENILYFDLLSNSSNVTIFYSDSLTFTLNINSDCARVNIFEHDYSGTVIMKEINSYTKPIEGSSLVYTQGMEGFLGIFDFNVLTDWVNDSTAYIVNQAELIIPVQEGSFLEYNIPSTLALVQLDSLSNKQFVIDQFEGDDFFNGTYDEGSMEYRFNISRFIHAIVNNISENNRLAIFPSGSAVKANRAILHGGTEHSLFKTKLILKYSKLEK